MDQQQSTPLRSRWYELTPYGAAFFASTAIGMMAILMIDKVGGRAAMNRWGTWVGLAIACAGAYWGQRLPRRALVAAMIVLWVVVFWVLTHGP